MKRIINNRKYVTVTFSNKEENKFGVSISLPSPDYARTKILELTLPLILIRCGSCTAPTLEINSSPDRYSEIIICYSIINKNHDQDDFEDIVNSITKKIENLCTDLLSFTEQANGKFASHELKSTQNTTMYGDILPYKNKLTQSNII